MKGWKTKAGAVGVMLGGLSVILGALTADPMNLEALMGGVTTVGIGLGMLGIGHKIEKNS